MRNWIFVVSSVSPRELLASRIERGLWPLAIMTGGRSLMSEGDRVFFYLGKPEFAFVGTAVIVAKSERIRQPKRTGFAVQDRLKNVWTYGVRIGKSELWKEPLAIRPIVKDLSIFPRKDCWGAYFQSGVLEVPEQDVRVIIGSTSGSSKTNGP